MSVEGVAISNNESDNIVSLVIVHIFICTSLCTYRNAMELQNAEVIDKYCYISIINYKRFSIEKC